MWLMHVVHVYCTYSIVIVHAVLNSCTETVYNCFLHVYVSIGTKTYPIQTLSSLQEVRGSFRSSLPVGGQLHW